MILIVINHANFKIKKHSVVLVSASPSLVLDQAYLQSTVSTDFVVSSSSSGSSCFVPRCLTPDAANQRRLLRFGLRVQNQGDAEASLALGSAAASTVTNDACSAATSINDFVSLAVKDSSNAVKASGVRGTRALLSRARARCVRVRLCVRVRWCLTALCLSLHRSVPF
jgi:hypothetical protein